MGSPNSVPDEYDDADEAVHPDLLAAGLKRRPVVSCCMDFDEFRQQQGGDFTVNNLGSRGSQSASSNETQAGQLGACCIVPGCSRSNSDSEKGAERTKSCVAEDAASASSRQLCSRFCQFEGMKQIFFIESTSKI